MGTLAPSLDLGLIRVFQTKALAPAPTLHGDFANVLTLNREVVLKCFTVDDL